MLLLRLLLPPLLPPLLWLLPLPLPLLRLRLRLPLPLPRLRLPCLPRRHHRYYCFYTTLTTSPRLASLRYEIELSTRPEKSVGSDEIWEKAEAALVSALDRKGWKYEINAGDGAFYGPKIDLKIRDAIGRSWQCSTIQCDFNLPERFGLEYTDSDGTAQPPIMLHRAIFGSVERFFGILLEDSAGDLPLWLAPVQMKLLPVTDAARAFAHEVRDKARRRGLRVEVDPGKDRLAKQIRNAELTKLPVVAVVGEKEVEGGTLAIRTRAGGDLGSMDVDAVIDKLCEAARQHVDLHVVE